ncbi:DUF4129 domain-containing protein [Chitinophagaceae bacterium MMS25-I14]
MQPRPSKLFLYICLLLFSIVQYTAVAAQEIMPVPSAAQWDSLTKQKDFNYRNERETAPLIKPDNNANWLERLLKPIGDFLFSDAGRLLMWTLLFAVLAFVLYRLFISDKTFIFARSRKKQNDGQEATDDGSDISGTDWEQELQRAISRQDIRGAIRASYMLLLRTLQEKELIEYRQDKTNYDYYQELSSTIYRQPFRQLTRQYEYSWYGHFIPAPQDYEIYMQSFRLMLNQLKKK